MRAAFLPVILALFSLKSAVAFPSAHALERKSLEVVQAQVPARSSYANPSCTQTIFNHVFANSYGIPYVGKNFKILTAKFLHSTAT
jgi:hypothetical protein